MFAIQGLLMMSWKLVRLE